jgi:hypothetical protein
MSERLPHSLRISDFSRDRVLGGVRARANRLRREPQQETISLGQLAEILADAHQGRKQWLEDLADDSVIVTRDLFEVLCRYRELRGKAA